MCALTHAGQTLLTPGEIRLWRNELKALEFGSQRSTSRSDMLCPASNPTLHAEVTQRPVSLYPHTALTWHW